MLNLTSCTEGRFELNHVSHMSLIYYAQLAKNERRGKELLRRTHEALRPFSQYLNNAIKSLEHKEVKAKWRRAGSDAIKLHSIAEEVPGRSAN